MKEQFCKFMDEQGLSKRTKGHYNNDLTSRIKEFAQKYCKDYVSIYDLNKDEAIKLMNLLENNKDFVDYYKKSNGSPISAFNKYREFLDYKDNESLNYIVGATDDNCSAEIGSLAKPCVENLA